MDSGRPTAAIDWPSRTIAILSLFIAIGAGGYAILEDPNENDVTQDKLIDEFKTALQTESDTFSKQRQALQNEFQSSLRANDQRMTDWNGQIVNALNGFEADAQQLVDQLAEAEKRAIQNRTTAFRQEIATLRQLSTSQPDPKGNITTNETTAQDTNAAATIDNPNREILATSANLILAESVMRPASGDYTLIHVENNGKEEAIIHRLQFRPVADFRVESSDTINDAGTDTITTIAYSQADNTSTKPGHHGIYDRTLTEPIRVPAGEAITFRVVIQDVNYVGWGFTGNLMLEYNSDNPLVVDTARIRFRSVDTKVKQEDLLDEST